MFVSELDTLGIEEWLACRGLLFGRGFGSTYRGMLRLWSVAAAAELLRAVVETERGGGADVYVY